MKRCTRCVIPETAPNVSFDENGVCSYCASYKTPPLLGEEKLRALLDAQRKPGKKYDCAIGISGGRDSSYTTLKLVKDYGMKVLALNYDNPFVDPQAVENIDNMADILNIDVIRYTLKNKIHERTFRSNLLAWLKKPSAGMIPMLCIACKNYIPPMIRYSKKHDIQCVVMGGTTFENVSFKRELINVSRDADYKNTYLSGLYGMVKETLKNPSYYSPHCVPIMVKGYFYGDQYALGPRLFAPDIAFYHLFDYIPWQETDILSRIRGEIAWKHPEKFVSTWRFDCKICHLKKLLYLKTIGMGENEDFYSKMIRDGVITRDEIMERLSRENVIQYDQIEDVLNQVDLKMSILKPILDL